MRRISLRFMQTCSAKVILQGSQVVSSRFWKDHRVKKFCLRSGSIWFSWVAMRGLKLNKTWLRKLNRKNWTLEVWQTSSLHNTWPNLTKLSTMMNPGNLRTKKCSTRMTLIQCFIKLRTLFLMLFLKKTKALIHLTWINVTYGEYHSRRNLCFRLLCRNHRWVVGDDLAPAWKTYILFKCRCSILVKSI